MTVLIVVVIVLIILFVLSVGSNTKSFIIPFVLVIVLCRVMWVLFHKLCLKLLLGYELDRSLQETQSAWSIMDLHCLQSAKKIIYGSDDNFNKNKKKNELEAIKRKKLIKFSKLKNADELGEELIRVKDLIADLRSDLICLENMKFNISDTDESTSKSTSAVSATRNKDSSGSSGSGDTEGRAVVSSTGASTLTLNLSSTETAAVGKSNGRTRGNKYSSVNELDRDHENVISNSNELESVKDSMKTDKDKCYGRETAPESSASINQFAGVKVAPLESSHV